MGGAAKAARMVNADRYMKTTFAYITGWELKS